MPLRCRHLLLLSAAWSATLYTPCANAQAIEAAPPSATSPPAPERGTPPPGFEDLEQATDTLFDVVVLGRRIGSFRATLSDGMVTFASPELLADALAGVVERQAVLDLLSRPLPANEQLRCYPGQTVGCGLLPPGKFGLIADSQRFSIEIFFDPVSVKQGRERRLELGPSSAEGFGLVQNVAMSVATSGFNGRNLELGGTLDTLASVGQTSFVAQTFIGTGFGARLNQGHLQHIWGNRVAKAGLIEDYNTELLSNYRMIGAEFGSFYPRLAYDTDSQGSPLDIVLPRDADVEIRRNGVLLSARRYGAGPQRLDTAGLPNGSYTVQIVARADGMVVLDEIRNFSRSGGLPIVGKTEFSFRAGLYVEDRFSVSQSGYTFFPDLRQSPVFGARVARRIAPTTSVEADVMNIDGLTVGEATVRTFIGGVEGSASFALADDGSYGASVLGSAVLWGVRFNLAARTIQTDARFDPTSSGFGRYQPFLRRENSIVMSTQFPLAGGTLGLSGGYSSTPGLKDRYTASARYSRAVKLFHRPAFLSAYALRSDAETRVGFSFALNFGIGPRTTLSVGTGAENVSNSTGSSRNGISPVVNASISHRDRWQEFDVFGQANASTSADGERLGGGVNISSPYGVADLNAQHVRNRSGNFTTLVANAQSGFAIGGGAMKLGLARPGEAVILTDLDVAADDNAARAANSGYRVRIDAQSYDLLQPGKISAAGVAALDEYEITLSPENAPPYDVRIDPRTVIVYPGNVVRLRYEARRDFTIFGQLIGEEGHPLAAATIRGGNDLIVTDQNGYFTLTVPSDSQIRAVLPGGTQCRDVNIKDIVKDMGKREFYRVGKIKCDVE